MTIAGICLVAYLLSAELAKGQLNSVSARVEIKKRSASKTERSGKAPENLADIVVWMKPLDRTPVDLGSIEQARKRLQLVQKNKSFQPHLLVVPVGSSVDFPNRDPFFHNVFSLFDGKRFDLGLYEAGTSNSVRFDRVGVSYLFCNIHPEMSAVVVALDTPYFGLSNREGKVTIANLPDGRYELHIWYERSLPEDLQALTRFVTISSATKDLGTIRIPENASFSPEHKNKYGQDYTPPPAPGYSHP